MFNQKSRDHQTSLKIKPKTRELYNKNIESTSPVIVVNSDALHGKNKHPHVCGDTSGGIQRQKRFKCLRISNT